MLTFSRIKKWLTSISLSLFSSAAHPHTPTRPICCFSTAMRERCVLVGGGGWGGWIDLLHFIRLLICLYIGSKIWDKVEGQKRKLILPSDLIPTQGFYFVCAAYDGYSRSTSVRTLVFMIWETFCGVVYYICSMFQITRLLRFDTWDCFIYKYVRGSNDLIIALIYSASSEFWLLLALCTILWPFLVVIFPIAV